MVKPYFELTTSDAPASGAKTISDPEQVEARLQALSPDLSVMLFHSAILTGLGARNETTPASACAAAGLQQWLKTVEELRTLLSAKQWKIHDEMNCPFISAQNNQLSIIVMTGDRETGKLSINGPTNQAEKGVIVQEAILTNQQFELFDITDRFEFESLKEATVDSQVWVLLYHYDKKLDEVRFELSCPNGFDKKRITSWAERLVLGNIPNKPAGFTPEVPNAPPLVPVEPKTGTF